MSEAEGPGKSKTVLAVKNNLLYDMALAPNIEAVSYTQLGCTYRFGATNRSCSFALYPTLESESFCRALCY